jgi:TPR repeat protein
VLRALALAAVCVASTACATTYHPEYHPEVHYSYVQNINYGVPASTKRCRLGMANECWNECFGGASGEACYLLGVMFETGNGVPQRHESAERLSAVAAKLGYEPAAIDVTMAAPYMDLWRHETTPRGTRPTEARDRGMVRSEKGVVVVYGNLNGDVIVGR